MSCNPTTPVSSLFEKTTRWFDRAKAALGDNLPCCQGCSHCCVGLFSVTLLDCREIQRGLRSLPDRQREAMEQTASEQAGMISASVPRLAYDPFIDHWPDWEVDRVVERFGTLPCPALGSDGSCGLYVFRPLACRSMGIPTEVEGVVRGACVVQSYVPLIRLSRTLREQETLLAGEEAEQLAGLRDQHRIQGEELLLPYAFLPLTMETPVGEMA